MKLYLVRHGESEANAQGLRLGPVSNLTEKGRRQAAFLAERFKNIPIDIIVSSSLNRALQTAEIINQTLKKNLLQSDLLVERKNPTEFLGKPLADPGVLEIMRQANLHLDEPDWHYSDEENFEDQKLRALQALDYLKSLEGENILVTTHGIFMRMLVACAIFGHSLTAQTYRYLLLSLKTKNTGITLLESRQPYGEDIIEPDWNLTTWNDHAHLDESDII